MSIVSWLFLCAAAASARVTEPLPDIRISPKTIEMGAFFNGARLRVSGAVASDAHVVIVVRGADREEAFNFKSRVGPIWLNTGKVHVSGAPSLFLALSSDHVFVLLGRAEVEAEQLDVASIRRQMRLTPASLDRDIVRAGYLSMKQEEGIYLVNPAGVVLGAADGSGRTFSSEFDWPAKAPPARYEIRVYECRDRAIARTWSAPLEVVKVGFPAWLSALAAERAAAYGGLAVAVAVLAGFGIDFLVRFVFGKKRPVHVKVPPREVHPREVKRASGGAR